MKKTILFAMMAAVLGFTACSKEEPTQTETPKKGMVLHATVAQPADSKATFTNNEGVWHFDFTEGDQIMVTNKKVDIYYTFTYDGTDFISADAEPTSEPTRWYAYFPSRDVSLVGQTGKWEDLANVYALAGSTFDTTGDVTGEEGLTINLNPAKLAFLKIENRKGSIDINVKDGVDSWVKGLTVSGSSFIPVSMLTKQTLLSTTKVGTYYIAVPAERQISIKDGDEVVKSTGEKGLEAGKYYELEVSIGRGEAAVNSSAGIPGNKVKWIQLWQDGPKFAEFNVGAKSVTDYGGHYCWGKTIDKDPNCAYWGGEELGDNDTATKLWGTNWRMPTSDELSAIISNCTCSFIDNYNGTIVDGLLCAGKDDYSSNSIFLPASGIYDVSVFNVNIVGRYWSSMSDGNPDLEYAYTLRFGDGEQSIVTSSPRMRGYSVRAVLIETQVL